MNWRWIKISQVLCLACASKWIPQMGFLWQSQNTSLVMTGLCLWDPHQTLWRSEAYKRDGLIPNPTAGNFGSKGLFFRVQAPPPPCKGASPWMVYRLTAGIYKELKCLEPLQCLNVSFPLCSIQLGLEKRECSSENRCSSSRRQMPCSQGETGYLQIWTQEKSCFPRFLLSSWEGSQFTASRSSH